MFVLSQLKPITFNWVQIDTKITVLSRLIYMELDAKKESLLTLGNFFQDCIGQYEGEELTHDKLTPLRNRLVEQIDRVHHENGWFTSESVLDALKAWSIALRKG